MDLSDSFPSVSGLSILSGAMRKISKQTKYPRDREYEISDSRKIQAIITFISIYHHYLYIPFPFFAFFLIKKGALLCNPG